MFFSGLFLRFFHFPHFNTNVFFFSVVCCLLIFHSWRSQSCWVTECKRYWFINNWLELITRWDQGRKLLTYFEPISWGNTATLVSLLGTLIIIFLCLLRSISYWRNGTFVVIKGAKFGCFSSNLNVSRVDFGSHFWKLYSLMYRKMENIWMI